MTHITCPHCGDTYPDFDVAHVCSSGQYAPKLKIKTNEQVKKLWADPRFQLLADIDKLLEGSKIWGGMGWTYIPIHPVHYLPVKERMRKAMDDLKAEYGVEE